jgi:hypothetical protein
MAQDKVGGILDDLGNLIKEPIKLVTPSQIKAAAAEVDGYAAGLNGDIVTHARKEFVDNWQRVYAAWQEFHAGIHGLETWTASTMDRIDEWRTKLDEWRSALITEEGDVQHQNPAAVPGAGTTTSRAAADATKGSAGGIDLTDGFKWMLAGVAAFFVGKALFKGAAASAGAARNVII